MNADTWNSGLCDSEKRTLLDIAHDTLAWVADGSEAPFNFGHFTLTDRLKQSCGAFVTLRLEGDLCGCVGSLELREPLYRSVHENTTKSATEDSRFSPLGSYQLESLDVHISILGPRTAIENIQLFHPGRHGILMISRQRRALFLPEVAGEHGWTREETVRHLCRKAGLPLDVWKREATFELFTTDAFGD